MVGGAAWLAVPGLPLAAAFTLGAILAPTDAVTTASIGRQLHLPRRLLTVITGESMLNDGTALTLYAVAVSAAATTVATPSPLEDVRSLLFIGAGGVAVGLVLGALLHQIRLRLRDPLVESALSLLAPFTAYLAADSLHVSGILAVVVAGLYLGHHAGQAHFATRLQDMAVWRVATFLLESVAFALIGLQLRPVLQDLGRADPGRLAAEAAIVLGAVIVARIAWVFPSVYLPRWLVPRIRRADPVPGWPATLVLSWAGLRGVISLAAAAALPASVPQRSLLVFLTFTAVLGTLLVQGLTLPRLIRWLGVQAGPEEEQADARPRRSRSRPPPRPGCGGWPSWPKPGSGRRTAGSGRAAAAAGRVPAGRGAGAAAAGSRVRNRPRGGVPAAAPGDDRRRTGRAHPAAGSGGRSTTKCSTRCCTSWTWKRPCCPAMNGT